MEIGAQLYTLKTYCQNEKDLARSLEKVAGMGYSCVQLSAIGPIAPERIKTICDDNGLKIVLTHTPEAEVHGRPEETIEKLRLFGCRYIGIGSLPERYRNPDFLPYFAEDFLPAAEKFKAAGMKLMYHNHCFEFERLPEGDTMMDRLLAMMPADLMGLTADTYWLQYGGVDVNQWLKEHAERLHCVHLKDYGVKGFTVRMEAVGSGNLDFPAILENLRNNGVTEYALVEQDDCNGESPFACLKRSLDYLRNTAGLN